MEICRCVKTLEGIPVYENKHMEPGQIKVSFQRITDVVPDTLLIRIGETETWHRPATLSDVQSVFCNFKDDEEYKQIAKTVKMNFRI